MCQKCFDAYGFLTVSKKVLPICTETEQLGKVDGHALD
jgi:hypothetical protein